MTMTASYGGTSVASQLPSVTAVIPTPAAMYTQKRITVRIGVLHCLQCPILTTARSIASGYLRSGDPHSVTGVIDQADTVQTLPLGTWTWGCGSDGNPIADQWEQSGYAQQTKAQWLGEDSAIGTTFQNDAGQAITWTTAMATAAKAQFQRVAQMIADTNHIHGWGAPAWGTKADLLAAIGGATVGKWFTHNDITQWGPSHATTHWDPGPDYPRDELMALAGKLYSGTTPTPTPAPAGDWFDMATLDDLKTAIRAVVIEQLGADALQNPAAALNTGVAPRISADRSAWAEKQLGASAVTNPGALLNTGIGARISLNVGALLAGLKPTSGGTVDVAALAAALSAQLGDDLAKSLGQKLVAA